MLILALETSCDETAAAVVRAGRTVLASVVASQITDHAAYGGVVPEIASRKHLEILPRVIDEALASADVSLDDLGGIAVTRGPGLVGALLVGVSTAQALAYSRKLPLVGVHHIEAHILSILLVQTIEFADVALAVSGGHTHLFLVEGFGRYRTLGQTLDDAAGEAFDKVGKLLELPYPGGPSIDRLAEEGDPTGVPLPRPLLHDGGLNFSFSGLKTAVLIYLRKHPEAAQGQPLRDLCASFQAAVCDILVKKTLAAAAQTGVPRLVVAGGVACNRGLRRAMAEAATRQGLQLAIPSPALCADNAAMVAVPADAYLSRGGLSELSLDAVATWPLEAVTAQRSILCAP
jgi:N6-L-threonylcarbamoyladenine synthase